MALHFYQPPTQELEITKQILASCYLPLLRMLVNKHDFGLTLNLSGSLIMQLQQQDENEFFDLVKKLVNEGKVEIVTSVMYHPLMPITPTDVILRQITKNSQLLQEVFNVRPITGFFPPELAVNTGSLDIISSNQIFVDESSLATKTSMYHPLGKYGDKYLLVNNHKLCNLLRAYSKKLTHKIVMDLFQKNCSEGALLVSVNDVELFGHHYSERLQVLSDLLDEKEIKFITASEAVSKFGQQTIAISKIKPSTWQEGKNFDLWFNNPLQKKYLALLRSVHALLNSSTNTVAVDCFDKSNSSCYLYWLSNWPWWHPGLVEKGVHNLIKCISLIDCNELKKTQLENACKSFLHEMWEFHKSGEVEKNYRKYDEQRNTNLNVV